VISRAVVSNTPYFPKKLPIVLVAALSTLVLCSGFLTTAELLRVSPPPAMAASAPATTAIPPGRAAAVSHPALGIAITAIDAFARDLRAAGDAGRRVAVVAASARVPTALTALTLARALAKDAKVVLVDVSFVPPGIGAILADPAAPGLSDLAVGYVSFGDIISRDRLSSVHLVTSGQAADAQATLASARVTMALRALAQAYDHLVLDVGDIEAGGLQRIAKLAPRAALVVADTSEAAVRAAHDRLADAGFADITVFEKANAAISTADNAEAA